MALTHIPDPRWLITENEHWTVQLNANQGLLGRCFLALKRPETEVTALTDAEVLSLWAEVRRIKEVLVALWEPDHFNYAFLMNLDKQVHFHIIPRYRAKREFAGGTFVDPDFGGHYGIGPSKILETEGYDAIIAALKRRLGV